MFWLMAIIVGCLFTGAVYLLQRRSSVKLIFGLLLLGHACSLLIFVSSDFAKSAPPIIKHTQSLPTNSADPVPQALILTAIVISFAVQAFVAVLFKVNYKAIKTDDIDEMRSTES